MFLVKKIGRLNRNFVALLFVLFLFLGACDSASMQASRTKTASKQSNLKKNQSKKQFQALLKNQQIFSVGENEADLLWQTSEPVPTSVSYGEKRDLLTTITEENTKKNHYLRIKNLKPDTTYYYRIDGVQDSELEKFKTLARPGGKHLFSFAVCTDTHLTNTKLDQYGALYKESWDILGNLVDEVNEEKVDFLVIKGDISHNSESLDYQALVKTTERLNCETYVVPGNHDKMQPGWGLFFSSFSPSSSSYFSLDHKKWHFVFLDSATGELDQGNLGSKQLAWLRKDLNASADTPTMIFMHHLVRQTVFPKADRFFVQDSEELLKIIASDSVVAVHSGHAHLNKVSSYKDTDLIVTGAVINYPTQYNVYHVYEKGYVQVSHRLRSYLDLGEISKETMASTYSFRFGLKSELVPAFIEGTLEDRSFMRKLK